MSVTLIGKNIIAHSAWDSWLVLPKRLNSKLVYLPKLSAVRICEGIQKMLGPLKILGLTSSILSKRTIRFSSMKLRYQHTTDSQVFSKIKLSKRFLLEIHVCQDLSKMRKLSPVITVSSLIMYVWIYPCVSTLGDQEYHPTFCKKFMIGIPQETHH